MAAAWCPAAVESARLRAHPREATTDAWFKGVESELAAGFAERGVRLHALDDLRELFA